MLKFDVMWTVSFIKHINLQKLSFIKIFNYSNVFCIFHLLLMSVRGIDFDPTLALTLIQIRLGTPRTIKKGIAVSIIVGVRLPESPLYSHILWTHCTPLVIPAILFVLFCQMFYVFFKLFILIWRIITKNVGISILTVGLFDRSH